MNAMSSSLVQRPPKYEEARAWIWLRCDYPDRPFFMLLLQFGERRLHALAAVAIGFSFGRADQFGMFLPLPEDLRLLAFDFFQLQTLPETVIEIYQSLDLPGFDAEACGDGAGGLPGGFARA